ncbi:hypothetical protein F7725_027670 [Dissostichus mawsoni]|uniref:Carrier domain-containing protein n=1 Tax=Dissostichus mawsoni TaxID=36200 RepID=A0A7J5XDL4_DISMA|nr:hypothetical protein F7725_027670 [Dissostichus mawsoni]
MAARTLQELVSIAASLHPERPAVKYDSGSVSVLLYRDLLDLSCELSRVLQRNCSPNTGTPAAYVPLDPEAPGFLSARVMTQCGLKYCAVKTDMLQQFQAALAKHISVEVCAELQKFKLTLTQIKLLPVAEHHPGPKHTGAQTADGPDLCAAPAAGLKEAAHRDLAYVLHTSGTTGLPKIMNADDVVLLASPLTFDPSVVDIFLALSSGAQLLIIPSVIKKMPSQLARLLFKDHKTTVLQASVTPTLLGRFGHHILKHEVFSSGSSLRVLALGGEACPSPALLRNWRHEDNKTHIYNIYGITEVSCWASCYKIPESLLQSGNPVLPFVPLGTPLMDTVLEIRDEHGRIVTEGEGQVFIGGEDRVCLLDDEQTVASGTMRATGDWVNVEDTQLYYLGRRDRMIKRHGKRVNLDSLQQLILGLPQVEACAVALFEATRLLAFVVPSTSGDQKEASPLTSAQKHPEQTPSAVSHHQGETGGADGDLRRLILNQLSLLLPSHSVPDTLVQVPALCLSPHVCVSSTTYQQETLGLPEEPTIDEKSNFLLSGGDSLKALHLCEDILTAFRVTSPELLEVILDGTFSDVLRHVERITLLPPLEESQSPTSEAKKRRTEAPSMVEAKRERTESTAAERPQGGTWAFKVIRRAGEVIEIRKPVAIKNVKTEALGEKDLSDGGSEDFLSLSLSWSSDTGRCVDASPVLLVQQKTDSGSEEVKTTVFIGSHSHRIQALDLTTGSLLWERVLGDRIEASAAVSHCGSLVVIGCYDGFVYFLCTASGQTRWMFKTGDAVKSCPAVDPLTGLVIVGSHDGHVYALDPKDSGEVLWSYCRDIPFFSSPNASSGHVLIGSVDGNICCVSKTGTLVWQFLTKGPIFSSPCVTPDHQRVLCGSHDGCLYCLNAADGSLIWTFQTTGKVYSSPGILVALASTDGTVWILDGEDGGKLASFTLAGELFSSPVLHEHSLVVGCRNDYVYCLKLTVKEDT